MPAIKARAQPPREKRHVRLLLKSSMHPRCRRCGQARGKPYVVVFCGVNGVGKSTNLAKIAYWLGGHGIKVMIAACDTFRAGEGVERHSEPSKVLTLWLTGRPHSAGGPWKWLCQCAAGGGDGGGDGGGGFYTGFE